MKRGFDEGGGEQKGFLADRRAPLLLSAAAAEEIEIIAVAIVSQ